MKASMFSKKSTKSFQSPDHPMQYDYDNNKSNFKNAEIIRQNMENPAYDVDVKTESQGG